MKKLRQDSASSGHSRQRFPFTDEEVDLLSTYFNSYISGLEVPSAGAYREFLANDYHNKYITRYVTSSPSSASKWTVSSG